MGNRRNNFLSFFFFLSSYMHMSLYYTHCIVDSSFQPLKAASLLNKISCHAEKFGEDRTCSSEDMISIDRRQTNTHRDRHTDTLITILLCSPTGRRAIILFYKTTGCMKC